jgi:hypothetical protein
MIHLLDEKKQSTQVGTKSNGLLDDQMKKKKGRGIKFNSYNDILNRAKKNEGDKTRYKQSKQMSPDVPFAGQTAEQAINKSSLPSFDFGDEYGGQDLAPAEMSAQEKLMRSNRGGTYGVADNTAKEVNPNQYGTMTDLVKEKGTVHEAVATQLGIDPEKFKAEVHEKAATPATSAQAGAEMVSKLPPEALKTLEENDPALAKEIQDESWWDKIPGADRVDWMSTLGIVAVGLAMGSPVGIAMAFGLVGGMKAKSAEGTMSPFQQKVLLQEQKEQGLNRRADKNILSRENIAKGAKARGEMDAAGYTAHLMENASSFFGLGGGELSEGEITSLAPVMERLAQTQEGYGSLPMRQQIKMAQQAAKGGSQSLIAPK